MRDAEKACAHAMVCQDDRSSETWKIASMAHQMSHAACELHMKPAACTGDRARQRRDTFSLGLTFALNHAPSARRCAAPGLTARRGRANGHSCRFGIIVARSRKRDRAGASSFEKLATASRNRPYTGSRKRLPARRFEPLARLSRSSSLQRSLPLAASASLQEDAF